MFENSLEVREIFVIEIDFITNFVIINLLFDQRGKLHIYVYIYITTYIQFHIFMFLL